MGEAVATVSLDDHADLMLQPALYPMIPFDGLNLMAEVEEERSRNGRPPLPRDVLINACDDLMRREAEILHSHTDGGFMNFGAVGLTRQSLHRFYQEHFSQRNFMESRASRLISAYRRELREARQQAIVARHRQERSRDDRIDGLDRLAELTTINLPADMEIDIEALRRQQGIGAGEVRAAPQWRMQYMQDGSQQATQTTPVYKTYDVKKLRSQKWYKENYSTDNLGCLMTFYMKNYKGSPSVNNLNYVRDLAGQSRTDISEWDLLTIFCDPKTSEISLDRREINKRFFSPRSSTEMIGGEVIEVKKGENKRFDISKVFEGDMKAMIANMQSQLTGLENAYNAKLREMNASRDSYLSTYSAHRLLTAKDQQSEILLIEKTLREIEEGGIFEVIKYDVARNSFYFKNKIPFIIKLHPNYVTPDVDRIDLGFFNLEVKFFTFQTYLTEISEPTKRLWTNYSTPGPFVNASSSGALCFGNEVSRVDRFLKTKDLSNHLRLVNEVMCQYEPGVTPHRDILYFINDQRQMNRYFKSGVIEQVLGGKEPTKEQKRALRYCSNDVRNSHTVVAYDFAKKMFRRINEHHVACPGCKQEHMQQCTCPT